MKINKIVALSKLFLTNFAFAMEHENNQNKKDSGENKEVKVDFTKTLPREIISQTVKYCLCEYLNFQN